MATVLALAFTGWQVPALDARLRHRDIGKQVLPVPAQINRRNRIVSIDQTHVRPLHIAIVILVDHHGVTRVVASLQVVFICHV